MVSGRTNEFRASALGLSVSKTAGEPALDFGGDVSPVFSDESAPAVLKTFSDGVCGGSKFFIIAVSDLALFIQCFAAAL